MKNIWKTIGIIVLVVIILGAICVGVGLGTGADASRIYKIVDQQYIISELLQGFQNTATSVYSNAATNIGSLF